MARARDVGGLRRVESLGAKAVETTVMGFSGWSDRTPHHLLGRLSFPHLAHVCEETNLPVSVDLEPTDEDLRSWAEGVRAALKAGAAGLSLGERPGTSADFVIEHIRVAREVISRSEQEIVLQVRCEALLTDPSRRDFVAQHLRAYVQAGADVLCIPANEKPSFIKAVVDTVAPGTVSVVIQDSTVDAGALRSLGVRRISMGFGLGQATWPGFERGYATLLSRAVGSCSSPSAPSTNAS